MSSQWEPLTNGQATLDMYIPGEMKKVQVVPGNPKKKRKSKPGTDFYKARIVVTRKVHRCYDCQNDIAKGSRAIYSLAVDGGQFLHGHFCNKCVDPEGATLK